MKATLLDRRHRREALTGGDQPWPWCVPPPGGGSVWPCSRCVDTSGQMRGQRGPRLQDYRLEKIGGWYPKLPSNGDRPVPDTGNELCAYSTHESCWLQEDGFWEATHRNIRSKSWLALSVWPLLWGWYPEERLTVAPSKRQNSLQNLETNWGPLSETTSVGRPWMRKTWSMTATAVSLADGNLGRGMKWAAFENRSTTVKTTVFPLEAGRPVTKSSEMWDQGLDGTDSGWRSPAEGRLEVLETAQTEQAKTKHRMSRAIDWPPEPLFSKKHGTTHPRMTSHLGTMTPSNDIGP